MDRLHYQPRHNGPVHCGEPILRGNATGIPLGLILAACEVCDACLEAPEVRAARRLYEAQGRPSLLVTDRAPWVAVPAPLGAEQRFHDGCRIAWTDPMGIGGVTLGGTWIGALAYVRGNGLAAVAIDLDPSEYLRVLVVDAAKRAAVAFDGLWSSLPRPLLEGTGGAAFFAGHDIERAVHEGKLTRIETASTEGPGLQRPPIAQIKADVDRLMGPQPPAEPRQPRSLWAAVLTVREKEEGKP